MNDKCFEKELITLQTFEMISSIQPGIFIKIKKFRAVVILKTTVTFVNEMERKNIFKLHQIYPENHVQ